jgi:hypothetical protein
MDDTLRRFVRERAGDRCEYCRLPQAVGRSIRFHIEHIRPIQHGGDDSPENLALACPNCNWHKGSNLTAIDPATGAIEPLFNPRTDLWSNHFNLVGLEIQGVSAAGRATAHLMRMNAPERLDVRRELLKRGELDFGV